MTQLIILTQFKQLIDDVKEKLNYYNNNLRNEFLIKNQMNPMNKRIKEEKQFLINVKKI